MSPQGESAIPLPVTQTSNSIAIDISAAILDLIRVAADQLAEPTITLRMVIREE